MRIVVAFCLFGAALGTVYAFAVYLSLDFIDDTLVDNRLAQEAKHILAHYQENIASPSTTSPNIKAYLGLASLPDFAKQSVTKYGEGFHEFYHAEKEYHLVVKTLPDSDKPLYLLYDVSTLEFTEKRKFMIAIVLIAGVILMVAIGFWIGLLTARRVIAPVTHLADLVNQSDPENLPTNLSQPFSNDEVGTLSKTLEDAMNRIRLFIKREQQFTRDASHELRTPVTVIKGAVEILQGQIGQQKKSLHRPLNRIKRAVVDMEHIITTFLWLAREESNIDQDQLCDVVQVVNETIDETRRLFKDKPIEIERIENGHPIIKAPGPAVRAVINNLIHNAFHNTTAGKITVNICSDRILISDTGKGIDACDLPTVTEPHIRGEESQGFGLGLAIAKRICHRFGWKLYIDSKIGEGTTVQLHFDPSG
jgi:signal transduction histidine kinase